jgi:cyclase
MRRIRVIPVLLLKNNGLVKTIKFTKPAYVGDPINSIKIFNEKEVEELIILDINASRENRDPNYDRIKEFASECFMPFTYGGGIRSIDQITQIWK